MHTWARRIRLDVSTTTRGTRLIVLNVPNGAGEGVIRFGSRDCFVEWTVQDVADRVALPYRQQTGVCSNWEYYLPDGGTAQAELIDFADGHYNEFGVPNADPQEPSVWAAWYPLKALPPKQSQFSVYSGAAALLLQLRTINPGVTAPDIAPVGFSRYVTVNSFQPCGIELLYIAAGGQSIHLDTVATPSNRRSLATGAWDHVRVTNQGIAPTEWCLIWDRYPEGGGS